MEPYADFRHGAPVLWDGYPSAGWKWAGRLAEAAGEWPIDAVAIAAALHQPWAGVVLSGAATSRQLASNLQALDVPQEITERLPHLAETPEAYWRTRSRLAWT